MGSSTVKKLRCMHCGKVIATYFLDETCGEGQLRIKADVPLEITSFKDNPNSKMVRCINEECVKLNPCNFAVMLGELLREDRIEKKIRSSVDGKG